MNLYQTFSLSQYWSPNSFIMFRSLHVCTHRAPKYAQKLGSYKNPHKAEKLNWIFWNWCDYWGGIKKNPTSGLLIPPVVTATVTQWSLWSRVAVTQWSLWSRMVTSFTVLPTEFWKIGAKNMQNQRILGGFFGKNWRKIGVLFLKIWRNRWIRQRVLSFGKIYPLLSKFQGEITESMGLK